MGVAPGAMIHYRHRDTVYRTQVIRLNRCTVSVGKPGGDKVLRRVPFERVLGVCDEWPVRTHSRFMCPTTFPKRGLGQLSRFRSPNHHLGTCPAMRLPASRARTPERRRSSCPE